MGTLRSLVVFLAFLGFMIAGPLAAQESRWSANNVPGSLVTTQTKQVYRFHISGLHPHDAVRLAEQVWPVLAKLPAENPLRQTFLEAKDRAEFIDEYRSLRNIFLEFGVDTLYFLADEYWIESKTLPGTFVFAGDVALRDRLQQRLKASGHDTWAAAVAQARTKSQAPGWLVFGSGGASPGQPSAEKKRRIVEHALLESCRIKPAAPHLGSLPAMRMALNEATPFTVVNLERNKFDAVMTQILTELVPASARTAELSESVVATTFTASAYPCLHVRQVAHLSSPAEATALAQEAKKRVDGAVQRVVDLDAEIGPLLGLFAQSMVMVSTQGNDVHLVMKPPALFDLQQSHIKSLESQDLDWTALAPPLGYHWEVIGSVGDASRYDVFARTRAVRVRGTSTAIAADDPAASLARFQVPVACGSLTLMRNLKGQLKVEILQKKAKKAPDLPALDLLDENGRVAAVLRLDLGPGDPRYDLARTRAALAKRMSEREAGVRTTKKEVDDAENALQKAILDKSVRPGRESVEERKEKLSPVYHAHGLELASLVLLRELDRQARDQQRNHPGATLIKDGIDSIGSPSAWAVPRDKFPFAGQWLFDYGVLTLYQDSSGAVAGMFASKVFHHSAKFEVDPTKPTGGSAIVAGRAKGLELEFAMYDHRARERSGKLTLNPDGATGTWSIKETHLDKPRRGGTNAQRLADKSPTAPPRKAATKDAESARSGPLDRIEVAAPDALCSQDAITASAAGYWIHPTDKRMNILFKLQDDDLLEGASGSRATAIGNLRAAVAGNLLVILENVNINALTPSVREAVISADGQKLTFLELRDPTTGTRHASNNRKGLELTRDRND